MLHKSIGRSWKCSIIQFEINALALVFQHGSIPSTARLNSEDRLCDDATSLGLVYTLGQYHLGFTVYSRKNGCAAADLIHARAKRAGAYMKLHIACYPEILHQWISKT